MAETVSNSFDREALAEIDKLLLDSDAGQIEYDKAGNPVYSDEDAQKAYEKALDGDTESAADVDESQQEQTTARETAETETAKEPDKPETEKTEPELKTTVDYSDEIEIPLPDGRESMTLGEMKDELINLVRQRETVEAQSNDLATEKLIVNAILSEGGEVTPERVEQLKQANERQRERDMETIAQMFPQWRDPHAKQAADNAMLRTGAELGATEVELRSITRPWIINMLWQLSDYKAREAKARQAMKKIPVVPKRPGTKTPPKTPANRKTVNAAAFNDAAKAENLDAVNWTALDNILR